MADQAPRTIQMADGSVVGYRESGDADGRPLLWFHGGLSSSVEVEFFERAGRVLGVRVIGLDRPGIGASTLSKVEPLAQWASVVAECCDRLRLEAFSVAGWSAGGPYALACALHLGNRVRSATTVAGMYPVLDPSRRRELGVLADRAILRLSSSSRVLARIAVEPVRILPGAAVWAITRASAPPAERRDLAPESRPVITRMLQQAVRHGGGGIVADYRRFGSPWGFQLGEVMAPITVLQGDADGMLPPGHAELLAAELPNADLVMIEGASHFIPMTHPDAILQTLPS